MENKVVATTGSGGAMGTVVWIVLIILKATGNIAMSWFLVLTSIIWIPLTVFIAMLVVALITAIIATILDLI